MLPELPLQSQSFVYENDSAVASPSLAIPALTPSMMSLNTAMFGDLDTEEHKVPSRLGGLRLRGRSRAQSNDMTCTSDYASDSHSSSAHSGSDENVRQHHSHHRKNGLSGATINAGFMQSMPETFPYHWEEHSEDMQENAQFLQLQQVNAFMHEPDDLDHADIMNLHLDINQDSTGDISNYLPMQNQFVKES
jgi:hypothetical protein